MAVNANKSGSRLLEVVEQIARSQPIGVRGLARILGAEKSAVQRAVTTLAEAQWIQPAANPAGSWELTGRILHIAHMAHGSNSLRQRARPILDALCEQTGETVYLAIPDGDNFVVMEVAESRQALRLVMPVGSTLPGKTSAAGMAIGSRRMDAQTKAAISARLAGPATAEPAGYIVSEDEEHENAINIAAPLLDIQGQAAGALVIYAVDSRLSAEQRTRFGHLLMDRASELSSFGQRDVRAADLRRAIGGFG